MKLLLDTHIWIWYALGNPQLPDTLKRAIAESSTELWLSPISIWEAMLLAEKQRIELKPDPADWIAASIKAIGLKEASLNGQIALLSRQIQLEHQDPADRFIAATAVHYKLTLATVDSRLVAAEWLQTISS